VFAAHLRCLASDMPRVNIEPPGKCSPMCAPPLVNGRLDYESNGPWRHSIEVPPTMALRLLDTNSMSSNDAFSAGALWHFPWEPPKCNGANHTAVETRGPYLLARS